MKKYIVACIILVVLLAISVSARISTIRNTPPAPSIASFQAARGIPITVAAPRREALKLQYELLGTIEPVQEVEVVAKVGETITSSSLALGRSCRKGEALVTLYDGEIAAQVRLAEAVVAQARSGLDKLASGARPQERRQTEAGLAAAQAQYESAAKEYERTATLLEKKAIPAQKAEKAVAAFEAAKADLEAARQRVSMVREGTRREDILTAEAVLKQALANLELTKIRLQYTRIASPIDGVVSRVFKQAGEQTDKDKPVFTVVSTDQLQIVVDVPREIIRRITPESPVRVRSVNEGTEVTGRIVEIQPDADPVTRTFPVKIAFENTGGVFRAGSFERAIFDLETRPDTLTLPRECIIDQNGNSGVYVAEAGTVKFQAVTTGLSGKERIEVLQGVSASDSVVLTGRDRVKAGAAVDVTEKVS
ncbi:MAG TPA: efflux RND transporter periplasmic adaptor subunit [Candidatus Ozemobacteraceae bacterium]|nr:efflux RND transporter periplasmic adaptor subunit [Candidatus Ozemobacteraceae bacterium]HQG27074.1 efflux RND transporter periplasmic adaptor subunit [Candidatus Ozemobacteraceae bacterium]